MISSYAHCVKAFSNCRNPVAGKPIRGTEVRLFKYNDEFHIVVNRHHLATITPDDVITFHPTMQRLYETIASSLVYRMHCFLPLYLIRVGQGRYRINAIGSVATKDQPEYFDGIQFDLRFGKCLNPRPDTHTRINKDARKLWLRDLRQFKKTVLVRFKLGMRGDTSGAMYFTRDELLQWIRSNECHDKLLNYLTLHAGGPSASYNDMSRSLSGMLNNQSLYLRNAYGVFDDAA